MQNDLKSSTDIQDNAQLDAVVWYVSSDMNVKQELLDLVTLRETAHGINIKIHFMEL